MAFLHAKRLINYIKIQDSCKYAHDVLALAVGQAQI